MSDQGRSHITRRGFLHIGAALATAPILGVASSARAQAKAPTKVLDFETRADVAKAEQEGEVIYYGQDSEPGIAVLLEAFR
jgi:poly(3-hydroxybutyrate) depolymerase